MPLGLEEEGFILQCYATVIDDLGGSGTYFIQEVQVGILVTLRKRLRVKFNIYGTTFC